MNRCEKTCDADEWCICEAVQLIETNIEDDIKDLSEKEKEEYLLYLHERIYGEKI